MKAFFVTVQWLLITIQLPFVFIHRWLGRGVQLYTRHVYYGWVVLKRRVLREPLWQAQDTTLGIHPPEGKVISITEIGFVTPEVAARGVTDNGRKVTRDEECDDPLFIELIAAQSRAAADVAAADAAFHRQGGKRFGFMHGPDFATCSCGVLAARAESLTRSSDRTVLAKIEVL